MVFLILCTAKRQYRICPGYGQNAAVIFLRSQCISVQIQRNGFGYCCIFLPIPAKIDHIILLCRGDCFCQARIYGIPDPRYAVCFCQLCRCERQALYGIFICLYLLCQITSAISIIPAVVFRHFHVSCCQERDLLFTADPNVICSSSRYLISVKLHILPKIIGAER